MGKRKIWRQNGEKKFLLVLPPVALALKVSVLDDDSKIISYQGRGEN